MELNVNISSQAPPSGEPQTPISTSSDVSGLFSQSNNRIIATAEYVYDPAGSGNLISMPNKTQGADAMTYDAENRQKTYTPSQGGTTNYTYDGDGHRVKKVDPSNVATVFVYNVGGQLIAEYTSGTPQGSGTSYLTSDHLGSTRVVTSAADAGGNVTVKARYDYLPYGEEISSDYGSRSLVTGYGSASDTTKQKFTQKERDSESGLDYFLARYYSSAQGRFTSSDPLLSSGVPDDPQTWNRYSYVLNNPLKYIDPFGLFVWGTSLGGSAADGDASRTIREKREQIRGAIRGGNEALNSGRLESTQKANLERALNAYGAERTDNGVTVAVGKVDQGADDQGA